nr:uncharacterized protein LOC112026108 [Quercus suber]
MGYKKKPQSSLLDLIEGQPGRSKPKLPLPPPKTHSVLSRSASTHSGLPPPAPQTSSPSKHEPAGPKQKKDKGKRPIEEKPGSTKEEGDPRRPLKQLKIGSQGQAKQVDAQSEAQAWLPAPMLRGEPLRDDFSLRDFRGGEGAFVADALERCLLLPADMAKLGTMRSREVFLSLKRYLGMAVQATYRLEEAAHDQGRAMDVEREKRLEVTRTLKDSEADLATARKELKTVKDQARRLGEAEEQLKIANELLAELTKKAVATEETKKVAEWPKDEAVRAKLEAEQGREEAWAAKEEAEDAAYEAGVAETEAVFKAQVPAVCRRYFFEVWKEALKRAGVEPSSNLWKEESVYPPAIREAAPDGPEAELAVEEAGATPGVGASVTGPTGGPVQGSGPSRVDESGGGLNEEAP